MQISRRALAGAVAERAKGITNATGYLGQIGPMNGLPGVTDTPADPPTKSADDLRVQPYFVLFPGIGTPGSEDTVGGPTDTFVDLDWPIQITAVAGDIDDLLALVDRIEARIHRWSPGLLGEPGNEVLTGHFAIPAGYDIGVLPDKQFTPFRLFVPMRYQLTAHI